MVMYYKSPALSRIKKEAVEVKISEAVPECVLESLQTETCFYVVTETDLSAADEEKLQWILSIPFAKPAARTSNLSTEQINDDLLVEIGPRLNFSTAFSTNAVSVCHSIGLSNVSRLERSTRYLMSFSGNSRLCIKDEEKIVSALHDPMTECRYRKPIETFDLDVKADDMYEVDIIQNGRAALEKVNKDLGLAFDNWDLDYYTKLFVEDIKRNPTNVECFDLAQSNSEHSRHWFFRGRLIIDGDEYPESLFQMIMSTQEGSNDNNIIKFNDNSSGIKGFPVSVLLPRESAQASEIVQSDGDIRHIIFTAETHNFPTGVAPFPGATTGTGGRIRDVHCTGKGAHVMAGTAGYSFGNLHIPGYSLPWEDESYKYPGNFASPVEIAIEASNGASDYGNKFGEPVLAGFARSFGMLTENGERREYIKPIMFSGGIGMLHEGHIKKDAAKTNMEVVKIGGPVYRIGVGGGAASSVEIQGDNKVDLDFGAVQRGDAEMEQKLNRFIRACIEMGDKNPICSIHDQGAGGNGNVLKELVDPAGARIFVENFQLGDPTLSALEIWGAEYQESNAMLVEPKNLSTLRAIAKRERCPISIVGTVTGDGKVVLVDRSSPSQEECSENGTATKRSRLDDKRHPVDLDLQHVLGKMPRKVFHMVSKRPCLKPLSLPDNLSVREAVDRVLRLPCVASKRYLTNKVDRSVTGLVAQQQCVGPLHTPLADVAVTALSYFNTVGAATAIGEQPIKGLVDPMAGARMSVGEALTNLVFARVTELGDVKCSGNWMWPAKLPGEGAALLDACCSMCDVMKALGIAVDGGKDSLSMAARVGDETVKAPGTLVISAYAGCPDIRDTVTPDLKCPCGKGVLVYVPFCGAPEQQYRLGGSALAQCYKQIGDDTPDLDDPRLFAAAFNATQTLIKDRLVTAGHDVSDGGLITCLLEMAFAGNCSIDVNIVSTTENVTSLRVLFCEELGIVLELNEDNVSHVISTFAEASIQCHMIGYSMKSDEEEAAWVKISLNGVCMLDDTMAVLRDVWEETSFQLERRQANPHCVSQEQEAMKSRKEPLYHISDQVMEILVTEILRPECMNRPKVAIIREEGSNSDRELAAAFHMSGFECWDVNMQDLCGDDVTLEQFRGLAFVGGFSYADVLGSAKGWAATALFNNSVQEKFTQFRNRSDTFSLGICNGCQLMALLGWIAPDEDQRLQNGAGDAAPSTTAVNQGVLLEHNESERFESRFATVSISKSPSIMLRGLEGTVFGMWVSHGEGKIVFKNSMVQDHIIENKLAPIRYVDDDGRPTVQYPMNPNGSPDGIAAVCSLDGRHLAIMPHPERCFISWQCPWIPDNWRNSLKYSPWIQIFHNAFDWCQKN